MTNKVTLREQGLVWFGAGVSIAEILTGTYLAPLGLIKGLLAIVLGHLIGGILFYLAALISARRQKSAMESVKDTFGKQGGKLFAFLNVLQLFGWTAIMIYDGALSATAIFHTSPRIWAIVIGVLVVVWIALDVSSIEKVNMIAMLGLFVLSIVLCVVIISHHTMHSLHGTIAFGAALELSASMPLSWLPVVGDYMVDAEKPQKSAFVSTIIYSLASCWMFGIGMAAARMSGTGDIATIMVKAGLGIAGLLIIVFSTVTTTFLDALSGGISTQSLDDRGDGKKAAIVISILGTVGACLYPMDNITNFLYLIGSVFAPMIAVMMTDTFILSKETKKDFDIVNLIVWLIGFALYRLFMRFNWIVGYTLPDIIITMLISLSIHKMIKKR